MSPTGTIEEYIATGRRKTAVASVRLRPGAGSVRVNGRVVRELGTRAVWGRDRIQVDGKEISGPVDRIYVMLNKPFGTISSMSDPEGGPVAAALLKGLPHRVYSVGRLDFDSMGLLLFTNDGEFAHRMAHPRYHTPRTYKATVAGAISEEALSVLKDEWVDLVLSDINMPNMNGLELIGRMHADEIMQSIPVVMVTTEAGDEKIKQSKELGAVGYIKKPFQPQDIKKTLCRIMGEETVDETGHDDEFEAGDF